MGAGKGRQPDTCPLLWILRKKIKIYKKNKEIQHILIPKIKIILRMYSSILNILEQSAKLVLQFLKCKSVSSAPCCPSLPPSSPTRKNLTNIQLLCSFCY
jgi:hypothetical protein